MYYLHRTLQMIEFYLNNRSGVAPYLQLVGQVKHALRVGLLAHGDQLPTVREVVAKLAINPNTVLKAYRALEYEGLAEGRPGQGTFVVGTVAGPPPGTYSRLRRGLRRWLDEAQAAGLDDESIAAFVANSLRGSAEEEVA
jgi:GntR family transcriptional regulator